MNASAGGTVRRPKSISARALGEHLCNSPLPQRQQKATTREASAFTPSKAVRTKQMPSNSYTLVRLTLELALLLFHQTFQLIEQLTIALADCIDDAGQHRLNSIGAMFEKSFDYIRANAMFEFFL